MAPRSLALGLVLFLLPAVSTAEQPAPPKGVLPRGADGRALNLDFETGDLRDWRAEGEAFAGQPVKGDTVARRRADMHSGHAGQYWVGTYERKGDPPQGTLTSAPFKVTHRYAAFLVGGGPHPTTCVELVRRDSGKVFSRTSGDEREDMRRVVVDLSDHVGKEIFIRLVDRHSGHWGHVNFDDFKFYKTRPNFPAPPRSTADIFPYAGLPPDKAAKVMTLPDDFKVKAFAGEPDVRQPIAMCLDDRGRLWVAEAYSYPVKLPAKDAHDRILIFEDTDGDGKFDKRTVFTDKLNLVSGLEVGFGGVWVGAAPELLFIPVKEGEDKPAGPPQVVLDGWGYHDTHETLNSFIWGPDGWLYGCHGVFTHSLVGKPGTPKERRTPINAGIWRYHPLKKRFEVFAYGTSNPWGVDFNDHGHAFLTCCVIPHLFHVIQGARYQRQAGPHFQPHTYADIQTIARHRHWVGNQWNDADRARSDASGGGHAHAGAMIYLGDAWPARYRGQLFMNNIHGARINVDRLTAKGSGYVGDGEPDFLKANDLWSQIISLRYGPDGQVYMIDWYDRNQCHHGDVAVHDRSNGRVFKVTYKGARPVTVDLRKKNDRELAELLLHRNDWYVRHARRILQERAASGKLDPKARERLEEIAFRHADVTRRLRGLWALHGTGGLSEQQVRAGLADDSDLVRSWTIQLALEDQRPSADTLKTLSKMARKDGSPVVRLYIASALQRLPLDLRWEIVEGLLSHAADADDHNLPLMYWYGAEPLAGADRGRALRLALAGKVPLVRAFMARRVGSEGSPEALGLLVKELKAASAPAEQLLFLNGIREGLVGRRRVPMPRGWSGVYERLSGSDDVEVRTRARALAVTFGDPAALAAMREQLARKETPVGERREFLAALLAAGDKDLVPILHRLLREPALRADALRGLAGYDDPKTPGVVLAAYGSLSTAEKRQALATLAARPAYARALLAAVGAKKLPATDLTGDLVRQLRNLKDAEVNKQIAAVWGVVRDTPADRARLIARYKRLMADRPPKPAELPLGRAVFARTCQQCHTLFGTGGKVGPELTGANRADLDYLLSNIVDPSAVVGKDYVATVIETKRGRVLTGLVREQTKNALTLVTATETVVVPRDEIESKQDSDKSLMPDDLLQVLRDDEVRALLGYLASPRQVPLAATPETAATFFNGRDLTGWQGDPKVWKVEDGEIVGTGDGRKRAELLTSDLLAGDFRLTMRVKITPKEGAAGILFRAESQPGGGLKGYRAGVGAGRWGRVDEVSGRGVLARGSGDGVKPGEWNRYEVVASGGRIRTYVNGRPCADLEDPHGARQGVFALELPAGGRCEVRVKDLKLELSPRK